MSGVLIGWGSLVSRSCRDARSVLAHRRQIAALVEVCKR